MQDSVHSGLTPSIPSAQDDGPVTYAIGDVHGRLDLLSAAFARIEADAGNRRATIICLGDYIDRGPDSRGVIDLLMNGPNRDGDKLICLLGNHEEMMLSSATGCEASQGLWMGNGGIQTVSSYGPDGIPPEHLNWLSALPVIHTDAHRIYVHAGLMPGFSETEQQPEWCLWIRDRFLREGAGAWSKHVVHGHTHTWVSKATDEPELLGHRTNLDTAAYHTGKLTVAVFNDAEAGGPTSILRVTATTPHSVGIANGDEPKTLRAKDSSQ